MKRKLEELNLLDDFLFGSVMSYPEIGEAFCRKILKILLNVDVEKLHVVPQKVYYGSDTDLHGTRLDVYIEEDGGSGTIFDVEPDKNDSDKLKNALPRRVRFYHSKIDGRNLKSGDDYSKLKQVIVLMIMPYDPFGRDRVIYTVRRHCEEDPEMEYDDGAVTIFFYTKGKIGDVSEEVRKLLRYMEHSVLQNAVSGQLREIHQMVDVVRHDEEVSLEYMKTVEREQMIREQGEKIGEARGEKIGEARGEKRGEKRGDVLRTVKILRNMRKTMKADEAASVSGLEQEYVERIFSFLEEYSEESDEEISERIISENDSNKED